MSDIFERVEYKYILSKVQYESIIGEINKHFIVDKYGETTLQSLYFDTDDFLLVRRSIDHPVYKEKVRLRSYGLSNGKSKVFLEIKKKYDGIVYKRRVGVMEEDVMSLLSGSIENPSQIEKELAYCATIYNGLKPKVLVLYDRTAMKGTDNDMRITFDRNVRFREDNLNLHTSLEGTNLFDSGEILMEIKTNVPYPLWLCKILSDNKIYKSSFSKYGTIYMNNYMLRQKEFSNV